jgi:hypothetical protein
MNDRQRKDRLIQTRVPQNLESTLKDEARKRRLSVSHLIRNVLEDTFNLVDNVVVDFDRVVNDSVEMAATLKRDAQRLAATARGETAHREEPSEPELPDDVLEEEPPAEATPETPEQGPLSQVYAFQELVLNRPAECARCEAVIQRGARGYLGLNEDQSLPRIWVCAECLEALSSQ